MANKVETLARNMRLTDNTREYVEKKAAKLERNLQEIDDIRVELTHAKTARNANDRQVAQITVRGKGFLLRTEERSDDLHGAFDAALEKIRKAGGTVHDKTFNDLGYIKLVFCTDPDGVRVELMQAGAS